MKKLFLFIVFLLTGSFTFSLLAQSSQRLNSSITESALDLSVKIDARELLEKFDKAHGIDYSKWGRPPVNLKKTMGWNFTVGSQKSWYSSDLTLPNSSPNYFYLVPSTCRAVGTNCYIFVEDALWGTRVNDVAVTKVKDAFDSKTPANAAKGIYQTNVETFGTIPDIDGDPKVIIFILDIKDSYDPVKGGGYTAGFFHPYHEYPKNIAPYSNVAEIYFLDANPVNLLTDSGVNAAMSTTAHEFQHMIHFNYLTSSEIFLNEGWSLIAEVINGYPLYNQNGYAGETNAYLLSWRKDDPNVIFNDYSRAAKFALYLKEQVGVNLFRQYLVNRVPGITGISNYLTSIAYPRTLNDIILDWYIANTLNNKTINSKWGYDYTPITKTVGKGILNPNFNESTQFASLSSQYFTFSSGKNLQGSITIADPRQIKLTAIKYTASSAEVEQLTPSASFSYPGFGTTYSKITLIVSHNDVNASSGSNLFTVSLKTTGEAVNIPPDVFYIKTSLYLYTFGTNEYVTGTNSQKIKGLYQRFDLPGSAPLKELRYYFGQKIVTGNSDPVNYVVRSVNSNGSPGDVLYLKSGITNDFQLPSGGKAYSTVIPISPDINVPNSFFGGLEWDSKNDDVFALFSNSANNLEGEGAKRAWFQKNDGSYMFIGDLFTNGFDADCAIGAKFNVTTDVAENNVIPASYELSQNYPNPFNPSTVISYQLSAINLVTLKVFDILGREVATLVNEYQPAGKHSAEFRVNSAEFSSGVYFYQLKAGNYSEIKKMMLIK